MNAARRILIMGNSGSGKSWLANRLAERREIHMVEPDGF